MSVEIILLVSVYLLLIPLAVAFFKRDRYGFEVVMGEFGSGKTQNVTHFLKIAGRHQVNVSNYYTGYTHVQVQSAHDVMAVLDDIYDYHRYVTCWPDRHKLFKLKPWRLPAYEERAAAFRAKYPDLRPGAEFCFALDEASVYFNPREFKDNFSGKFKALLKVFYQPRKLKLLFLAVVQSPLELDVKIRRLATYYVKYYKGLGFFRWAKKYYFPNPEEMDFEKADLVGTKFNVNFYPYYPNYDYSTVELIDPSEDCYEPGSIYRIVAEKAPKEKVPLSVGLSRLTRFLPKIRLKRSEPEIS